MKAPAFAYRAPDTLEEALALLAAEGDGARVLAGGQSLMPALNLRLAAPAMLVDINGIVGLAGIDTAAGLRLGSLTRHRQIETDPVIAAAVPLLAAVAPHVAHLPIRTRGTLGGSLAHADPAAEWPAICLACDAVLEVQGLHGPRRITAEAFFRGVFLTALEPGELLTTVAFPPWPAARRHGFHEVARRHGDFAMVGAAVTLDLDADGRCAAARIVLFGAADRPLRRAMAEASLVGMRPTAALLRDAAALAGRGIDFNTDLHASADYRRRVAPVMVRRALADTLGWQDERAAA